MAPTEPTEGELGPDAQGLRREDTQVEGTDPEPDTDTGDELAGDTDTDTDTGDELAGDTDTDTDTGD